MNRKTMKRIMAVFVTLTLLYGCTADDGDHAITEKPVEPLTVASAQSLYEQYIGETSRLKSAEESQGIDLLPDWSRGQLFCDSNWYVVESPLEFPEGRQLKLIAPGVAGYAETHTKPDDIEQLQRLIMIRNTQTGETYAFVMLIAPELEYMLQKGNKLDENKYLTRESDLDGLVMFYTTDGRFVNGWIYESGRIAAGLKPETGQNDLFSTKASTSTCYGTVEYYYDTESGKWLSAAGIVCGRPFLLMDAFYDGPSGSGGGVGGIDLSIDPIGGGGGGTGTPSANNEKKPEVRTDCTDKASQNSQKAQDALGNIAVKVQIESLRINAKTNSETEYGVGISYDPGFGTYSITGGKVWQGTPGTNNTDIGASRYTVFTAHTHYTGLNAAPSCGDIIATVGFYKDARKDGGSYRGMVTFAADGKEYMIYVNDPAALEKFYNGLTNNDFYERGGENGDEFKDKSVWDNAYEEAKEYMQDRGYSKNDAQSYALSHVLDHYNTGLKISTRQGATGTFKEQKTVTEGTGKNTKYTPKICP